MDIVNYITYNTETNRIIKQGTTPSTMLQEQVTLKNEAALQGEGSGATHYVVTNPDPVITLLLTNNTQIDKTTVIADSIDKVTLSNLPPNAELLVLGMGGNLQQIVYTYEESISFDLPGLYTIQINAFPYLPYKVTINAS